jgi:hypothetical protein
MSYEELVNRLKVDLPVAGHQIFPGGWAMWLIIILSIIGFIAFLCWVLPIYSVWAAHKSGQADLAKAKNEQQVQVAEANGRLNAAEINKQAQMIEAEAISKSVEIIGKSLHDNAGYLQWQWIKMMEDRDSGDTIYVPTEAGLPILEAGKRRMVPNESTED